MSESIMTIDIFGTKQWRNEAGQLHRLDGPAVEWTDGTKKWYQNGLRHRVDSPAIEWTDGSKQWYQNGQRHRLDGPADEWANGFSSWYYHDDWLGSGIIGFWSLWELLDEEQRQSVNLHMWLGKLTND